METETFPVYNNDNNTNNYITNMYLLKCLMFSTIVRKVLIVFTHQQPRFQPEAATQRVTQRHQHTNKYQKPVKKVGNFSC